MQSLIQREDQKKSSTDTVPKESKPYAGAKTVLSQGENDMESEEDVDLVVMRCRD